MAIGDSAKQNNYPLVPETGEEGKRKWGAREINRTRDMVADVAKSIPVGMGGYRAAAKISYGTGVPANTDGVDGEIWLQII